MHDERCHGLAQKIIATKERFAPICFFASMRVVSPANTRFLIPLHFFFYFYKKVTNVFLSPETSGRRTPQHRRQERDSDEKKQNQFGEGDAYQDFLQGRFRVPRPPAVLFLPEGTGLFLTTRALNARHPLVSCGGHILTMADLHSPEKGEEPETPTLPIDIANIYPDSAHSRDVVRRLTHKTLPPDSDSDLFTHLFASAPIPEERQSQGMAMGAADTPIPVEPLAWLMVALSSLDAWIVMTRTVPWLGRLCLQPGVRSRVMMHFTDRLPWLCSSSSTSNTQTTITLFRLLRSERHGPVITMCIGHPSISMVLNARVFCLLQAVCLNVGVLWREKDLRRNISLEEGFIEFRDCGRIPVSDWVPKKIGYYPKNLYDMVEFYFQRTSKRDIYFGQICRTKESACEYCSGQVFTVSLLFTPGSTNYHGGYLCQTCALIRTYRDNMPPKHFRTLFLSDHSLGGLRMCDTFHEFISQALLVNAQHPSLGPAPVRRKRTVRSSSAAEKRGKNS
jgi:hypothetical protein